MVVFLYRPCAPQAYQCKISGSLCWFSFIAKTNGHPRFVTHKQLSVGKTTLLNGQG